MKTTKLFWANSLVESIPGGQMDLDGELARGIAQFVGEAVDLAPDALTGIFRDHPPMLIAVFALALAVTPLLAVLMSSDQTEPVNADETLAVFFY
jgi:hypothetical protein